MGLIKWDIQSCSGEIESSPCVGKDSSDYWGLRPQGIVIRKADLSGSNSSSAGLLWALSKLLTFSELRFFLLQMETAVVRTSNRCWEGFFKKAMYTNECRGSTQDLPNDTFFTRLRVWGVPVPTPPPLLSSLALRSEESFLPIPPGRRGERKTRSQVTGEGPRWPWRHAESWPETLLHFEPAVHPTSPPHLTSLVSEAENRPNRCGHISVPLREHP